MAQVVYVTFVVITSKPYNETPVWLIAGNSQEHCQLFLAHLSKAAVLLPKCWQATQGGDRGVTPAATGLSGGLAVDVVMVPVQVVVTG